MTLLRHSRGEELIGRRRLVWCGVVQETGDVRLPRLHAQVRADDERTVLGQAQDHLEADAGQACRGQQGTQATPTSTHPGAGAVVTKRGVWTPRLLRRPRQHRRDRGLPHPGDPALVQGAAASQPAHTAHLDADEPHRDSMATTRPPEASVPRHAVRRQNPRQEPSAVIPHAGICAGGRRQRRSLPRSFGSPRSHSRMS